MIDRKRDSIVLSASGSSFEPAEGFTHYTAANHGVIGLMKNIALELPPYGVRCNAVCPGAVRTGAPVVVVGAFNSHYSGRLGYYAEQATSRGLVVLHTSSASPVVAALGGTRPVLGANPFCAAFPTSGVPVTIDFSTSAITHGEVHLAANNNVPLPAGKAVDQAGLPTTDPQAALDGAILP